MNVLEVKDEKKSDLKEGKKLREEIRRDIYHQATMLNDKPPRHRNSSNYTPCRLIF